MNKAARTIYPYIPNSAPEIRAAMLAEIGAASVDDFYADIPESLRLKRPLDLPQPLLSETELTRHINGLLNKNQNTQELLSFLGAGCWQHQVPAVCDEINSRSEFLTAYAGEPYEDHGRFQALFEYTSMMAELLNMEVVNVPNYDGYMAAATSLRMAARLTGRSQVILAGTLSREKHSMIAGYLQPDIQIVQVPPQADTGLIDPVELKKLVSPACAAVYFENPSYLGVIETQGAQVAEIAHQQGAVCVVAVDPISLGVLKPPADYGGDIACGDIQPLGIHMHYGGGHGGFIASHDQEQYVMEFPSRLFGVVPTSVEGEYGFGDVAYERTSFAIREQGKEWVGTAAALWGITAGVYLALMGPQGMREIGERIMQRSRYAINQIERIPGVRVPFKAGHHFKDFLVDFTNCGKPVREINQALLARGILGGKDLSAEHPELGQSALYSVTEIHTQVDIDRLATTLEEVLQ